MGKNYLHQPQTKNNQNLLLKTSVRYMMKSPEKDMLELAILISYLNM